MLKGPCSKKAKLEANVHACNTYIYVLMMETTTLVMVIQQQAECDWPENLLCGLKIVSFVESLVT